MQELIRTVTKEFEIELWQATVAYQLSIRNVTKQLEQASFDYSQAIMRAQEEYEDKLMKIVGPQGGAP